MSRRELARRLAAKHPDGVNEKTVGNFRTAIRRYLKGDQNPNAQTRKAYAEALGIDASLLPEDDEDEDLEAALLRFCRKRSKPYAVPLRAEKWVEWSIHNGVFDEMGKAPV